MNLLIDNAPDRVNGIPVYTDYRNMVQFELLMRDPDIDNLQKVQLAIDLLYKEPVSSFESAWDGLLWFYRGGVDEQRSSAASSAEKRVYDYEQDAGLIYAAFRQVYGISLQAEPLHWWEFLALLSALPDSCTMGKVMGYRAMDTSKLKGPEKRHYQKLQRLWAIKTPDIQNRLSAAQREADMHDKALKRYREAQIWIQQKSK